MNVDIGSSCGWQQIKDITEQDLSAPHKLTSIVCKSYYGMPGVKPNIVLSRLFFQRFLMMSIKHAKLLILWPGELQKCSTVVDGTFRLVTHSRQDEAPAGKEWVTIIELCIVTRMVSRASLGSWCDRQQKRIDCKQMMAVEFLFYKHKLLPIWLFTTSGAKEKVVVKKQDMWPNKRYVDLGSKGSIVSVASARLQAYRYAKHNSSRNPWLVQKAEGWHGWTTWNLQCNIN